MILEIETNKSAGPGVCGSFAQSSLAWSPARGAPEEHDIYSLRFLGLRAPAERNVVCTVQFTFRSCRSGKIRGLSL